MSWGPGKTTIEDLLHHQKLEHIIANPAEAKHLLNKARVHLHTSLANADADPEIAYDALYAAARKALTALLMQQGLRPTRVGGHEAVIDAVEAQLVPPMGKTLHPYRNLRRMRASGDYLGASSALHSDDVMRDHPAAIAIVEMADKLLSSGTLPVFVPSLRSRNTHSTR